MAFFPPYDITISRCRFAAASLQGAGTRSHHRSCTCRRSWRRDSWTRPRAVIGEGSSMVSYMGTGRMGYIYIRLIIWGSSILPVIWGTRIWSSNQWWWFMGELWENFQNYGTGNGIMEWWWANRLLFGCFNLHSENYENQLGLLFRNIWEKTCPKPPTSL